MTDCPNGEMRDLLPDLLHARLAPASRAEVEAHVAGCADCRAELALLGELRGTLRRTPAVDVSAIVAALPRYQAPARRAWGGWRAAAAIAAVAIGGASVVVARHDDPAPVVAASDAPAASVAPPAEPLVVATARPGAGAPAVAARELPVSEAVGDLTEAELTALLADMESLDMLPSADAEHGTLVPAGALPSAGGAS